MYALNWNDDSIWQINRNASSFPIKHLTTTNLKPTKIRFCKLLDLLVMLGEDDITITNRFGSLISHKTLDGNLNPHQIIIHNEEIWIVGDWVECLTLPTLQSFCTIEEESLKVWEVYPPLDLMILNNETMYILPEHANFIQKIQMKFNREDGW
ncbi:MAG: hypothetical protein HN590_08795 [Calditrichaeota bacterium]|nr:hypothetical protein [Calditrichota bacterium]